MSLSLVKMMNPEGAAPGGASPSSYSQPQPQQQHSMPPNQRSQGPPAGPSEPLEASQAEKMMQASAFYQRRFQAFLDSTTPYAARRWGFTAGALVVFMLRILLAQGWYIVCYGLFLYLLNLFLAFLTPKFDPSLEDDLAAQDVEEGEPGLPTSASSSSGKFPNGGSGGGLMSGFFGGGQQQHQQQEDEFRPFIRRLPEFKFWLSSTQAVLISIGCTLFSIFDIPVYWPILVMYFFILFALTMRRQIQCVHSLFCERLTFTEHLAPTDTWSNTDTCLSTWAEKPPIEGRAERDEGCSPRVRREQRRGSLEQGTFVILPGPHNGNVEDGQRESAEDGVLNKKAIDEIDIGPRDTSWLPCKRTQAPFHAFIS